MICTVIQNKNFEQIEEILENCEMAEIRLDSCSLSEEEIQECFTSDVPLVATCRLSEVLKNESSLAALSDESKQIKACKIVESRLCTAIEAGARYVDVEIELPKYVSKRIRQCAHENGTIFMRSFHDFQGTDSYEALMAIVEKCHYHGADLVKIVTTATSEADVKRVLSLYEGSQKEGLLAVGGLIAFCMGELGHNSRIEALKYGAPFTYAALSEGEQNASGQWICEDMMSKVYGDFVFTDIQIPVTSSKSFAQRAIVAAALADGVSHLKAYTACGDNESAIDFVKSLGAKVEIKNDGGFTDELIIEGIGASQASIHLDKVNVGESGLLTRMAIPLLAHIADSQVIIEGERTLENRTLAGVADIMEAFGAEVHKFGESTIGSDEPGGENKERLTVPLTVNGPMNTGRVDISGKNGSQLISGLLMTMPLAQKNTTINVAEPKSIPYMFITLDVLRKFGIRVANDMLGGREFLDSGGDWNLCSEIVFKIKGGQSYHAADFEIEGDWSAAANFLVAGAIFGKALIKGLDTTSLQADLSIMDILMDAGASLSQLDGNTGDISVQRAPLQAFDVDATHCPDLFPIVSVLAAFCQGESRIAGVSRLKHKECNRCDAIVVTLSKMGVNVAVEGDELVIKGMPLVQRILSGELLHGGEYSSFHDHRMAMALKVAAMGADSPVVIDDLECIAKSNPYFISAVK